MFDFVRIISKINSAVTIIPKIVGVSAMNSGRSEDPVKSIHRSIASDWQKIGKDMERGLTQYDRALTEQVKVGGSNK